MLMFTVGSLLGGIKPRLGRCEIGICSRNTLRRLLCGLCEGKGWETNRGGFWCKETGLSLRSIVHSHHLDILGQWKGGPSCWNPAPNGYNMIRHSIEFLYNIHTRLYLSGGLEHEFDVSIYWECHHPNWWTPSFFRGVGLNHQPFVWYEGGFGVFGERRGSGSTSWSVHCVHTAQIYIWLVVIWFGNVWNMFYFHFIYGMSSFPLTFTPSFFKMVKTSNQILFLCFSQQTSKIVSAIAPFCFTPKTLNQSGFASGNDLIKDKWSLEIELFQFDSFWFILIHSDLFLFSGPHKSITLW